MLGTEFMKTKDKRSIVSALSVGSKEMETVRISKVSCAGLGVCIRS